MYQYFYENNTRFIMKDLSKELYAPQLMSHYWSMCNRSGTVWIIQNYAPEEKITLRIQCHKYAKQISTSYA